MKKKIGLYGGTFDPVHFGHINLALSLKEIHQLDEVWFCPAYINPHKKEQAPLVSAEQRLEMLELALEGLPSFFVLDIEIKKKSTSYTIDTIRSLLAREEGKQEQLFLLLGEDALQNFAQWREPEEIVKLVPLLIGMRESSYNLESFPTDLQSAIKKGMTRTRVMDISSTEVRDRLKKRLYCGHLVPAKILDYITRNGLYF